MALRVARRDRELVQRHVFAGEDPPRDEGIERVDVERDDETGPQSPREVVNQAAAARTEHEDAARRMTPAATSMTAASAASFSSSPQAQSRCRLT